MLCCVVVRGRRLVLLLIVMVRRASEQTNQPGQRIAQHAEHDFQAQEAARVFLCILFV